MTLRRKTVNIINMQRTLYKKNPIEVNRLEIKMNDNQMDTEGGLDIYEDNLYARR